jgi:hypothetical protein
VKNTGASIGFDVTCRSRISMLRAGVLLLEAFRIAHTPSAASSSVAAAAPIGSQRRRARAGGAAGRGLSRDHPVRRLGSTLAALTAGKEQATKAAGVRPTAIRL